MTVASEAAYAELNWTGAETLFSPGFIAEKAADVVVQYVDGASVLQTLTNGTHFRASLDGAKNVTVTPIALPSASAAAPVTLQFSRATQALQGTDFANLGAFDKSTYTTLFDRLTLIAGDLKSKFARAIQPFVTTSTTVDFGTRTVRGGTPLVASDFATKAYADLVSGTTAAIAAAASAAAALVSQLAAAASATAAAASAAAAATSAALLGSPDMGTFSTSVTSTTDLGATW
jgi:hypothetical protein